MSTEKETPMTSAPRRSFAEWFARTSSGRTNDEATVGLADVVQKVIDSGAKGSLSIDLSITPVGKTKRQVQIEARVTKKLPRPGAEVTVHFVDDKGELHRDDPFQGRLPQTEAEPAEERSTA